MSTRTVPRTAHLPPSHMPAGQRPPPQEVAEARGGDGSGHSIPKPWPTGTDTRTAELPASRDPAQLSVWPHHRNLRKLPFHRPQHIGHVKPQQTDRWPMWGPVTVPLLPPGLCKCRLLAALLGQLAGPTPHWSWSTEAPGAAPFGAQESGLGSHLDSDNDWQF